MGIYIPNLLNPLITLSEAVSLGVATKCVSTFALLTSADFCTFNLSYVIYPLIISIDTVLSVVVLIGFFCSVEAL
jgi:hypothetical protein